MTVFSLFHDGDQVCNIVYCVGSCVSVKGEGVFGPVRAPKPKVENTTYQHVVKFVTSLDRSPGDGLSVAKVNVDHSIYGI